VTGGLWKAAVVGCTGGAVGAGAAVWGSIVGAGAAVEGSTVSAGAAAWSSTGAAEGAAGSTGEDRGGCATGDACRGAEKPGGEDRGAGPAGMGGMSVTGASSGNSASVVACCVDCTGAPGVCTDVPAGGEGAGRSSSLVRKSSSWEAMVRCLEKGKVVSSKMT
jgi:hypothetical protein